MSAALALQEAVYKRLKDSTALASKISEVYDGFPDQEKNPSKFPFITIGDANSVPFNSYQHAGEEVYFDIHIWSRYRGFKEGLEITGIVQSLFNQQEIDVEEFGTVSSFLESTDTMRDTDGITRHIILRYRFIIQY
jgi:hypothetical protein